MHCHAINEIRLEKMYLTFSNYCRESIYHHLIVEFDCEEKCVEENIKDTALFYQKLDETKDWLKIFTEKNAKNTAIYERCSPLEGPLISVNNSENQMVHSVTGCYNIYLFPPILNCFILFLQLKPIARGVQGLLQTIILGVLSSPVIKNRVFYFSRVSCDFT